MARRGDSGMGLLIGAVMLFAAVFVILYFGTAIIGTIDADISTVNFSNETASVHNATKNATEMTFTLANMILPLIVIIFLVMLLMMLADKFKR